MQINNFFIIFFTQLSSTIETFLFIRKVSNAYVFKSVHISRAGVYIKPLLVQCANNAIRDKSCPYFKLRYDAIKKT